MARHVLVLNQYAVPKGQPGGTRHVELFDRLPKNWSYTLVVADRNHFSGVSESLYRGFRVGPVSKSPRSPLIFNTLQKNLLPCNVYITNK